MKKVDLPVKATTNYNAGQYVIFNGRMYRALVDHTAGTFDTLTWQQVDITNNEGRIAGQLQITMINTGGNTTVDTERDVMHTISMICPPNSDVAEVHIEGKKVGEVTYASGGSNERGTFFYIPPGNAVNDFCFQSITTYTMAAADRDITFDRTAVETGLRYNVPNINAPMTLRVPKGLYDFGNTFTIVNGSSETCIVRGADDDHQLFGGVAELEVPPQKEITFTETGFPRGNVWAVEGGKTIINHNENTSTGNELHLTLNNTGAITGRHGNYYGVVTPNRPQAGQYSLAIAGHVLGDDTTVQATARSATGAVTLNAGASSDIRTIGTFHSPGYECDFIIGNVRINAAAANRFFPMNDGFQWGTNVVDWTDAAQPDEAGWDFVDGTGYTRSDPTNTGWVGNTVTQNFVVGRRYICQWTKSNHVSGDVRMDAGGYVVHNITPSDPDFIQVDFLSTKTQVCSSEVQPKS